MLYDNEAYSLTMTLAISHKLSIISDTALRIARLFGTDAAFWINLQAKYEIETNCRAMSQRVEAEVTPLAMTD